MSRVRFRRDRPEEMCGLGVGHAGPWTVACTRIVGHAGLCIAPMGDAAEADGVCHWCRAPIGAPHDEDCGARRNDG